MCFCHDFSIDKKTKRGKNQNCSLTGGIEVWSIWRQLYVAKFFTAENAFTKSISLVLRYPLYQSHGFSSVDEVMWQGHCVLHLQK